MVILLSLDVAGAFDKASHARLFQNHKAKAKAL